MKQWWKETVFYEIYMPSFKDGNNDGIGDFIGITDKLDYLKELGVGAVWLTPFYASPRIDNGYDISGYMEIDPIFGNENDFDNFLKEAHKRNIKVIADLVINHTSTEHEWFKESSTSRRSQKRDWYIWQDVPNNWESFFGGSAWEYNEVTKQYYYHSFAKDQADLNWNSPEVKEAIYGVIDYWLSKGIDGFRLDVINNLTLNKEFPDNPYNENGEQVHLYDKDQNGLNEILEELNMYIKNKNKEAFLVGEISSDDVEIIASYSSNDMLDVTFNFNFGSIELLDIQYLFNEMKKMETIYKEKREPTLFFGSHDLGRSWNRLANGRVEIAEMLAVLILTARGIPFVYFGDEIGMEDFIASDVKEIRDIQGVMSYQEAIENGATEIEALETGNKKSRDKSRSPMQWENEEFSNHEPWISESRKVGEERYRLFKWYKQLIALRKKQPLSYEPYKILKLQNKLLYFQRGNFLVLLNFGDEIEYLQQNWEIEGIKLSNNEIEWTETVIEVPALSATIIIVR
ncbi:alpha-amylase family glycosyl hydrolase [Desemzia incerta]|uniref:alpha-amylase family glycosyl hydrolase n=1 Tax=Desemzia incerta TaxID=82801 RepID=UPI0016607520|nr:alpha-amylase family glycosyl hydrolase [Desemzia incerta]